jgi:hypothetical protein
VGEVRIEAGVFRPPDASKAAPKFQTSFAHSTYTFRPGSRWPATYVAKFRTKLSSARQGMLNHGSASRSFASWTMYSSDMPLTIGSLGVPSEPEPWRISAASRRSAQVTMSDVFVSCRSMKRSVLNAASRSRNRGWNGEKAALGCQRSPTKLRPFQAGIQTLKPRTGSLGLVASIRIEMPESVGVTSRSAKARPAAVVPRFATTASAPNVTTPEPSHSARYVPAA